MKNRMAVLVAKEIRRRNLLLLIKQAKDKGMNQRTFSESVGIPAAQMSQMVNKHRSIGDATARRIERSLKLPSAWFDSPQWELGPDDAIAATVAAAERRIPLINADQVKDFDAAIRNYWKNGGDDISVGFINKRLGQRAFAFRKTFKDMEPEIPIGSLVIVDDQEEPIPEDICEYYVPHLDRPFLRTLALTRPRPRGVARDCFEDGARLEPINPRFATVELTKENPGVYLGKVVAVIRFYESKFSIDN